MVSTFELFLFSYEKARPRELQGRDFSTYDAARILMERYDISLEKALADAGKWVAALVEQGIVE